MAIKATYIGKEFLRLCEQNTVLTVHSVFPHAINLMDKTGALFSILSVKGDAMVANLLTSAQTVSGLVTVGQTIVLRSNGIMANGRLLIAIPDQLPIWTGEISPKNEELNKKLVKRNVHWLLATLQEKGYNVDVLMNRAKERGLPSLIGLGQGLTPSGDDFLCGYLALFTYIEKSFLASFPTLEEVRLSIQEKLEDTTDISQHFLSYAIGGLFGEATLDLLQALFFKEVPELHLAFTRKAAYGASSGKDEICGMLFGIIEYISE